ncbi:MAG: response regulator transcription factor [Planctomycetes bacterium]|nr:response regulator transcription factor [Planctomycetota bacterium]
MTACRTSNRTRPLRLLLVEDDPRVVSTLREGLAAFDVELFHSGTLALAEEHLQTGKTPDAIVLDLNLPDGFGGTFAARCRKRGISVPIIMLTARDEIQDRIAGLQLGADDYMCKPFAVEELIARLDAVLRRSRRDDSRRLRYDDIELDLLTRTVKCGDTEASLSTRELDLLAYFMLHAEEVLSKQQILREVWGDGAEHDENLLQVYANYLRNKLAKSRTKKILHTVRGVGYVFSADEPRL